MKNLKITLTTLMLVTVLSASGCKGLQKTEEAAIENQEETTPNEVPAPEAPTADTPGSIEAGKVEETPAGHSKEKADETATHQTSGKKK